MSSETPKTTTYGPPNIAMRLYIDTNAFQLINTFAEYMLDGNADSLRGRRLSAKRLADLAGLRVLHGLALRSEVHIVLGPAALYEIGASRQVDRTAAAYALAGKSARLFAYDEGSFVNSAELDTFADVQVLRNVSLKDRRIFVDALLNECEAVVTCDYRLIRAFSNVPVEYRRIPFVSPSEWLAMGGLVTQRDAKGRA